MGKTFLNKLKELYLKFLKKTYKNGDLTFIDWKMQYFNVNSPHISSL